jgi:uncharacterized membrane protein (UPF0127 family)
MKKGIIALALICTLTGAAYFAQVARGGDDPSAPTEKLVIVSPKGVKHTFDVEIAATPVDRQVGLMFREKMDPDHGMLFEMDNTDVVAFWMRNTLIPLDMVFIAPDGVVKTIHENAVPRSEEPLSSDVPVNGILELNGGRAKALGIAPGDKVVHPFFNTSK